MASLVTKQFSYHAAKAFANSFLADSIYLYLGKPDPWADENSADAPVDTHLDHVSIWNNMAGAVRVSRNSVAVGVDKNVWATGTIYEKYNDSISALGSGNGFYVLANTSSGQRRVYKCLDNNGNSASTIVPTHEYTNTQREDDGYIWKYMYTISDTDYDSFATANVIPVPTAIGNVSTTAGAGTILNIPIPANNVPGIGYNYRGTGFSNGTSGVSIADANVVTAIGTACNQLVVTANGLSATDDFYNNCAIMFTSGASRNKIYNISDYDASANTLTVTTNMSRVAVNDTFKIGPKIAFTADGSGLTAIGNVNDSGNLISIDVASVGFGYSNVRSITIENKYHPDTVSISANGVGAYANIYIPPFSGHGYNPAAELQAKYAIVSAVTPTGGGADDGDGYFVGYNQNFRQFGLLRNPITSDGVLAKGTSYDLRTHLYFDSTVSATSWANMDDSFPVNSIVTNANTGATARVWNHSNTATARHLTLVDVVANSGLTFASGQYVIGTGGTGLISRANADQFLYQGNAPISPALGGQLAKYSGEIIYHENISPINRVEDQKETLKLVFEF